MEFGHESVSVNTANYGAGAGKSGWSVLRSDPVPAAPVHANVDLPFKPLAPFVPAEHWDALVRRDAGQRRVGFGWLRRKHGVLERLLSDLGGAVLRRFRG